MGPQRNQREVENRLRDAVKHDRARIQIGRISRFGLLELSRQRLRPSLDESTQSVCPRCNGAGNVRSVESLALAVLRLVGEEARKERTAKVIAQLPMDVANYVLNEKRDWVQSVQEANGAQIVLIGNPDLETPELLAAPRARRRARPARERGDELQAAHAEARSERRVRGSTQAAEDRGSRGHERPAEHSRPDAASAARARSAAAHASARAGGAAQRDLRCWSRLFGWLSPAPAPRRSARCARARSNLRRAGTSIATAIAVATAATAIDRGGDHRRDRGRIAAAIATAIEETVAIAPERRRSRPACRARRSGGRPRARAWRRRRPPAARARRRASVHHASRVNSASRASQREQQGQNPQATGPERRHHGPGSAGSAGSARPGARTQPPWTQSSARAASGREPPRASAARRSAARPAACRRRERRRLIRRPPRHPTSRAAARPTTSLRRRNASARSIRQTAALRDMSDRCAAARERVVAAARARVPARAAGTPANGRRSSTAGRAVDRLPQPEHG